MTVRTSAAHAMNVHIREETVLQRGAKTNL